jgi:hypothetical protein
MHSKETVDKLHKRINDAVEELFKLSIKNQETKDDIICFLCNGQNNYGYNMFGPGEKGITDQYQSEFLIDYLNTSEENEILKIVNNDEDLKRFQRHSVNIELMIYTHIWETDRSLSNLKHLANFIEGIPYDWKLKIPWKNKRIFITKNINEIFEKHNLDIANILNETYNNQLRNAFAHGQYGLLENTVIQLFNCSGKPNEIHTITFAEWEERFIKTVDLFIEISNQKYSLLKKFSIEKPILRIWTPGRCPIRYHSTEIFWDKYAGYYSFNPNVLKHL